MKKKLRLISAVIILSMIFPLLSGIIQPVFAANIPIKVYVDSYDKASATVNLHWDSVPNVKSGTIQYHVPNSAGTGADTITINIDPTKNTASISHVKSDIIYDFKIMLIDGGYQQYDGQQYFLPQVSFFAEQVEQQSVDVTGGGVETGVYPAIKLSWNMPKVYNGSGMTYANEALPYIDGNIGKLDFTVHLKSDKSLADILLKMDGSGHYTAAVSGDTDSTRWSDVKWDSATGKLYFYVLGVKDSQTLIPSIDAIRLGSATIPQQISLAGDSERSYVLPHPGVLPGTIYTITMNTLFTDNFDKYIGTVAEGLSENPLIGSTDYTYTPIRFQLTKDTYDNVYVRIYRINQGGLTMPRLYYEIQTSNVPSDQDTSWTTRKKLDDTYFNGEYAITVVTGINSKNTVYYRVIVKSDGVTDRVQSLKLPYTMQDDTAKPPVPKEIVISKVDLAIPAVASGITDKSSNITIAWDKPSNWDQIKGHVDKDIYFHFLISVSPKDLDITPTPMLEANGNDYGQYPVKYRLVKYVSANSPNIIDTGTKLVYTLKSFDANGYPNLFKGEDDQGNPLTIQNPDTPPYPTYLLPNKTYYLQMYTTLAANRGETQDSLNMSEKSLVTSFTTLSPTGRDVPIPKYVEWVETTVNPSSATNPADATIKIRFDDLKIDWSNYTTNHDPKDAVIYDLYMSTRTEPSSFGTTPIGTTELAGDVAFTKQTLGNTTWWYATINKFSFNPNNVSKFGKSLSPNTTYYFMIKVRLKMVNEAKKESVETALLTVTTPRGEATTPDDTAKRPIAPTDFAIATDKNGNPMVSGQTVTFEWTVNENIAAYNLIATSNRVEADTNTTDSSISLNSTFMSFISAFGDKDNNIDDNSDLLTLNPNLAQLPANFSYDSKTKKCRYTIDTWLYPNKIYYFSLRSVVKSTSGTKTSVWVSIPVTTSLIESPSLLQVVNDCELAFYWYDNNYETTTESYKIMVKTASDSDYTQLAKSQYKIVKNGSVYYGRLFKLKPNTQYSIKVIRTTDNAVLSTLVRYTRDDYYQIDVKWQGYVIDPYSGFEIAIKTEDDSDYTVLNNDADLEQYADITTHTYPYYIEKENSNLNTNYYTYNARIKLAPTKLPDGTIEHRPLAPNTKYFIKVRAIKIDSTNSAAVTPSKYVGPVNTRTEFNQDEYDNNDNNLNVSAKFLDMIDKLEQDTVWEVNKKNGVTNKIFVRDDKIINMLEGYGHFTCTIDVSNSSDYINSDEVYLAQNILKAMKTNNKSVIIKTKGVEYTIRPETFNTDDMEEFKNAKAASGSKDVYLKINNTESTNIQPVQPANTVASAKMDVLSAQAVTSLQTNTSINGLIKDKLYNDKTGIIQKKLAIIKNPNNLNVKGDAQAVNEYLNQLYEEVKSELSYYLEDTLNGAGYTAGVLADKYSISKFSSPLGVKMSYKSNSISNPYVLYGNVGNWQKLTQNLKNENGYLSYFVTGTGKYTIFSSKDVADTVANDSEAKPYISKLAASYDLTSVFPGADVSFNSALNVTVKESILLYELLLESQNDGLTDVKAKAKAYGIDKIINITNIYRNITRQEAAAIVIKLYCEKTGTSYDKLKASYTKVIKDDSKIAEKYAIPVYLCLQMNIMTLDSSANFNPTAAVTRANIAVVLQKMLEA